ncbi:hypothetical protein [Cellulomonas fengjieae]|uniref:hypothetical protein n=1 Tax=Cellulomonas fengjieae TaxID=2819978 RepID=UPI001AAE3EAA|nr:hypothetical protein [Cellulomonas fengjieae]MBO3100600.1 hypothetical protein [Cellulomonas fengjieae]
MRHARPVAAIALAVLTVALAGCAGQQSDDEPPAATPTAATSPAATPAAGVDCGTADVLDALEGGGGYPDGAKAPPPLPADLDPIAVVWCRGEPVGSPDAVVQQVTFDDGIAPVLEALAQPTETPGGADVMCTLDFEYKPVVFLVDDAGRSVRAYWPVDVCDKTLAGAGNLMAGLTPTSVVDVERT